MPTAEVRCVKCGAREDVTRLERCPICLKPHCRKCAARRHGKLFCSVQCADAFFFGNPDEEA